MVLPWAGYVHEYAMTNNTDLTTAAYNIVKNLRTYKQLEGLQNAIEQAKQQLNMLDTPTAQKQQILSTLMNLQLAGFSKKDIAELTGVIKRWSQGNGDTFGNGSKLDYNLIGVKH